MQADFLHAPRIQELQSQMESTQTETDKRRFLTALVRELIKNLSEVTVSNLSDGVNINNLDEVHAALRNELTKANKPITDLLNKLNLSTQDQTKLIDNIEKQAQENIKNTYETVTIKRLKTKIEVENLSDIVFPTDVKVNNLVELTVYLEQLIEKVSALKLAVQVDAPQITVNPTPVNIPETILNVPTVDLSPIIEELRNNLKKLKANDKSHPLAVRLTDGGDWVKQLVKVQQETSKAVAAFAGGSDQIRILDVNRQIVNPVALTIPSIIGDGTATVTTAGTRVQLSATSVPCRYVIIIGNTGNTGKIYVGGITIATARGRPLNQEQSEKIDIDNLNKVYIDADNNSDGCSYTYVN